jgi:HK97 family phage portal protein
VVACVGLRAGAFAQLPIKAYTDNDSGVPMLATPQPSLLLMPSDVVVPSVWKTQMSISRDLWGFALGQITDTDGNGAPSRVEWFPPDICRSTQDRAGGPLRWKVGGQDMSNVDLLHVPSRWVLPGNPQGVSPLEYSGLTDLAKRAQEFGREWFRNGAVPSSIIYSDTVLSATQGEELVEHVTSRWSRRKPAVLGQGMKYEQVSVAANESQFLETCRQAASDIAISFNLPPSKIAAAMGSSGSIEYGNRDQAQAQYLVDSINPDLIVIAESFDRVLSGVYCKWTTAAFLQSDLKTRYESYKLAIEAGFLTVDEVRALEERAPMPTPTVEVSA